MRISDWSSDVCSSDLPRLARQWRRPAGRLGLRGVAMEKLNFVGPLLSSIIPMLILVGAVAILFAALIGALGLSGSPAPVAKPLLQRRAEAIDRQRLL